MSDEEKSDTAKPSSQASADYLADLGVTQEHVDKAVVETVSPKPSTTVARFGQPVEGDLAKRLLGTGDVAKGLLGTTEVPNGLLGTTDVATGLLGTTDVARGLLGTSDVAKGLLGTTDVAKGMLGAGNVGLIGDLFKSPPYADFAKGITSALTEQRAGFKFIDATFATGLSELLAKQNTPLVSSLALEALQGFKSDVFVKGLADGALTGYRVPTLDLFAPATPEADKAVLAPAVVGLEPEVKEATIEPAEVAEPLPTAVVTEIHEERTYTQEAFVAALKQALVEAAPKKRTRLESIALWATVIGVPLGILAAILIAIFL
jgi:hypothetical protein